MSKAILGIKIGMTQIFDEAGVMLPVTVIQAGPCTVVQKKTLESDGYEALQIAFGEQKPQNVSKSLKGHFAKSQVKPSRYLRELSLDINAFEVGAEIKADVFSAGDFVDITGTSKGKGFQGVVKRHGFKGGRATHGSMFHRAPGSIGASAFPSRVLKNKRLPGHMGVERVTVQGVKVVKIDAEKNLILVNGAVPGAKNSLVVLKSAIKKKAGA